MTKSKFSRILFLPIMLCILLAFVACGSIEAPSIGGNKGGRLPSVVASSVSITNDGTSFWVSWDSVSGATTYVVKSGSASLTTSETIVDLTTASDFSLPEVGEKITITIIAKGDGFTDSSPTSITYEEGKQVRSPEIISFSDGIITWNSDSNAKKYIIKVNGTETETTSNTFSVAALSGSVRIDIWATDGSSFATLSVMYNSETNKLSLLPVTDYTLSGEILRWSAVGGAIGYKVVDLNFNSYVVTTTHYIMDIRNIVYGVYPVTAAGSIVSGAEVAPVDIKYLNGKGTESDPYIIKTPFDLRTIDYYELRSAESNSTAKNYYKIANNIDYNTVSALEGESNVYTLQKPFFGVLDGGGYTLSNMAVYYSNGFWSLFEFIASGGTVMNIKFASAEITSEQDGSYPVNAAVAMLAYRNYGIVMGVSLESSKLISKGGGVAGLVGHNFGTVSGCTVTGCELKQNANSSSSAAHEMAGVVLENYGTVSNNNVYRLTISGSGSNISSAAGVVSINRSGGKVTDNSFDGVTITNLKAGKEAGGIVAYCATGGTVTKGSGTLGTLKVGTATISVENGTSTAPRGTLCGKKG